MAERKTKVDETDEVRKTVMSDMRITANLFITFQQHNIEQSEANNVATSSETHSQKHLIVTMLNMFRRDTWNILRGAIISSTTADNGNVKCGSNNTVYYLLLKVADILRGESLTMDGGDITTKEEGTLYKDTAS